MHERVAAQNGDIYVSTHREQEYCKDKKIEFRRLDNGVVLLGMPRQVEDRAHASIDFTLPSGAYFDPPGKSGLHHFMEHIVTSELGHKAHADSQDFNASTGSSTFSIHIGNSVANPHFREFGVWPILRDTRQLFNNPFYLVEDMEGAIEKEKGVVFGEMVETAGKQLTFSRMQPVLFATDNPARTNVIGTETDVKSITSMDVYRVAQGLFRPQGLTISVFTEGDSANCKAVVDDLAGLFETYRKDNGHFPEIDRSLLDKLNPDFKKGTTHKVYLGTGNGVTNVNLAWNIPREKYSLGNFSSNWLSDILNIRIFAFLRRNGLGYTAKSYITDLHERGLFFLSLDIPTVATNDSTIQSLVPTIQEQVIAKLEEGEVDRYIRRQQTYEQAVPMSTEFLYSVLLDAYNNKRRIIDFDKLKQRMLDSLNTSAIMQWKQTLLSEEPTTLIVST